MVKIHHPVFQTETACVDQPFMLIHIVKPFIVTWPEVQEGVSILWLCSCPAGHPSQELSGRGAPRAQERGMVVRFGVGLVSVLAEPKVVGHRAGGF